MSEWQPIETAPKDGVPVLLWPGARDWTEKMRPVVGWHTNLGLWVTWSGYIEPTHWTPIPEPPK